MIVKDARLGLGVVVEVGWVVEVEGGIGAARWSPLLLQFWLCGLVAEQLGLEFGLDDSLESLIDSVSKNC